MTRDDIIRMAREAGMVQDYDCFFSPGDQDMDVHITDLERFAVLVAAVERNKLAAWMMAKGYATGHGDTVEDLLTELEWQVRESEREACAKVCEDVGEHPSLEPRHCAASIRARGKK